VPTSISELARDNTSEIDCPIMGRRQKTLNITAPAFQKNEGKGAKGLFTGDFPRKKRKQVTERRRHGPKKGTEEPLSTGNAGKGLEIEQRLGSETEGNSDRKHGEEAAESAHHLSGREGMFG